MSIELLPCPFCGYDEPEIERYGTNRYSTIINCGNCGCSLESGEEWDHGRRWNERWNVDNELISSLKAERDEADRRAGAAQRKLEWCEKSERIYAAWIKEAKEEAGYDEDVSFDHVWAEALAALREKRTTLNQKEGQE